MKGRPRSVTKGSTPAIGTMPMDNAYRAMVTQGSRDLFNAHVKYFVRKGMNQWKPFL